MTAAPIEQGIHEREIEQERAYKAIVAELKKRKRAQFQMTMGSGKTFVAIRVAQKYKLVVVFVPTIVLMHQFRDDYRKVVGYGPPVMCVEGHDEYQINMFASSRHGGLLIATYASQEKVRNALQCIRPDLVIADEAHRTAGLAGKAWARFIDSLDAKRMLFQTGTVKTLSSKLKESSAEDLRDQLDEESYGRCVYNLPMNKAIQAGIVSDYKVCALVDAENLIPAKERKLPAATGRALRSEHSREPTDFEIALIGGALRECVAQGYKKLLVYANTIADVRFYADLIPVLTGVLRKAKHKVPKLDLGRNVFAIWQDHSPAEKSEAIESFAAYDGLSVLLSCKTLTEGVSIPVVDSALLLSARRSRFDLAQIVGRTQRLHATKDKPAMIFVPAIVSSEDDFEDRSEFATLREVLTSLAHYDESWKQELRSLAGVEIAGQRGERIDVTPRLVFSAPAGRVETLAMMRTVMIVGPGKPIPKRCEMCGNGFLARPSKLRRGQDRFCSQECWGRSLRKEQTLKCDGCGVTFVASRNPSRLARREIFCTRECSYQARRNSSSAKNAEIGSRFSAGISVKSIAAEYGVSERRIRYIIARYRTRQAVGSG